MRTSKGLKNICVWTVFPPNQRTNAELMSELLVHELRASIVMCRVGAESREEHRCDTWKDVADCEGGQSELTSRRFTYYGILEGC
jgi:hypothetical protein